MWYMTSYCHCIIMIFRTHSCYIGAYFFPKFLYLCLTFVISQFARSNDWPRDKKQGHFRIGIQGNTALYNLLVDKYAGQSIGSQILEIIEIDDTPQMSEFIHVLYTESKGDQLMNLINSTAEKPIMVVTSVDTDTVMPEGAVVNFVVQTSRIRYELDMENALKRGLIVGNRILSWAITR